MNVQDYLDRLKEGLSSLSGEEQADIINEISGHIESGEGDTHLGPDLKARAERLSTEMGSPENLSRGFRNVLRPRRWIDYLLVVGPNILVFTLVSLIIRLLVGRPSAEIWWGLPEIYFGTRAMILIQGVLIFVSLRRSSPALLVFWLPETILTIFSLYFREKRWEINSPINATSGGVIESLFWLAVMAGLAAWLVRLLIINRDYLLLGLAILPLLITVGNMAAEMMVSAGVFPEGYSLPHWTVIWNFGPYEIGEVLWPALFFIRRERPLRWLGLLVYALLSSLMNLVAASRNPLLSSLWSLPVLIVLVLWFAEIMQNRNRLQAAG